MKVVDGICIDGLVLPTEYEYVRNVKTAMEGDSISEYVWREDGEPPVFRWNEEFESLVAERIRIADAMAERGICLWPWRILEAVPKDRAASRIYDWNQGPIPSCSMHAAAHAHQFTTLVEMAMGAPLNYEPVNPIYPFYLARGGNCSGGLTLFQSAEQINKGGHFACSDVGDDNRNIDNGNTERFRKWKENAAKRQSAVVYLEDELVERIFRAAHAGFYVSFGSNTIYSGAREDKNGVKVMCGITHGGHAQCLGTWRSVKGTEYVFLQNSHGDRYGKSKEGEPASGAWCSKDEVAVLASDMKNFGLPWIGIPEEPNQTEPVMMNDWSASFPEV